jgi:hypothetical protein
MAEVFDLIMPLSFYLKKMWMGWVSEGLGGNPIPS